MGAHAKQGLHKARKYIVGSIEIIYDSPYQDTHTSLNIDCMNVVLTGGLPKSTAGFCQ